MKQTIASDIAVLVFTSALNLHERALSVQNTWLRDFPNGYLVGGYYYDPTLKMISLGTNVGEDYLSATPKQFIGLKVLYEKFPNIPWFYVSGCDAYLFAENLCDLLSNFNPQEELFIGGNFLKRTIENVEYFYPSGGSGFVLSNQLVKKLLTKIDFILENLKQYELFYRYGACDAALGYYFLTLFGIKPVYADGFYSVAPYKYPGDYYYNGNFQYVSEPVIDKPIAFHTLTIREMYALYAGKKLKKRTFIDKIIDKVSYILSRKIKTKTLVNRFFQLKYWNFGET